MTLVTKYIVGENIGRGLVVSTCSPGWSTVQVDSRNTVPGGLKKKVINKELAFVC